VIGLLTQSRDAVKRYIEDTGLPFDVLIDERRDVVRAYGASWIGDNQRQFPGAADLLRAAR